MIYLTLNQSNTINVTLYEGATNIINPYFTWSITNQDSKANIIFTANDYSCYPWYYNSFTISVYALYGTASVYGLTNGSIYVKNTGYYDYTVYEMANPYDTNIADAVDIVETGLIYINGTYSQYVVNTFTGNSVFVNQSLNYYDQ